jgi:hypothetical protein
LLCCPGCPQTLYPPASASQVQNCQRTHTESSRGTLEHLSSSSPPVWNINRVRRKIHHHPPPHLSFLEAWQALPHCWAPFLGGWMSLHTPYLSCLTDAPSVIFQKSSPCLSNLQALLGSSRFFKDLALPPTKLIEMRCLSSPL